MNKVHNITVSIVTSIYDTDDYLENCFKHLTKQTLPNIEFIWIDNGASNKCRRIISKYAKSRPNIKVVHFTKNIGYAAAIQKGISLATGEYIGFCDSDDWIDSDYFEILYKTAKQTNSDIVYTRYKHEYKNKHITKIVPHITNIKYSHNLTEHISCLKNGAIWDKIFHRKLLTKHPLKLIGCSAFEDNILLIKAVSSANSMTMIEQPYYHYLQRNNSTIHSSNNPEKIELRKITVIHHLINYSVQHSFSDKEKYALFDFIIRSLGLNSLIKRKTYYYKLIDGIKDSFFSSKIKEMFFVFHPNFTNWFFYTFRTPSCFYLRIFGIKLIRTPSNFCLHILGIKLKKDKK